MASLLGGSVTALIINASGSWASLWDNLVLPAVAVAWVAGIVVSLLTPKSDVSTEEALRILDEEWPQLDIGTELESQVEQDK